MFGLFLCVGIFIKGTIVGFLLCALITASKQEELKDLYYSTVNSKCELHMKLNEEICKLKRTKIRSEIAVNMLKDYVETNYENPELDNIIEVLKQGIKISEEVESD